MEEQRNIIREFLKVNKMQLKTLFDLYSSSFEEDNVTPNNIIDVKVEPQIETINKAGKDLEEVMSFKSPGSNDAQSVPDQSEVIKHKESAVFKRPDHSRVNSEKGLIGAISREKIKDCSSGGSFHKQKDVVFTNNKLLNHRMRVSVSPDETKNDKRDLTYTPVTPLEEASREHNYTETTHHNTCMKQIIIDAGIELSDDEAKNKQQVLRKDRDVPLEPQEKPTFFETCVDVPPYLRPKDLKGSRPQPVVYKHLAKNRVFRVGLSQGKQIIVMCRKYY